MADNVAPKYRWVIGDNQDNPLSWVRKDDNGDLDTAYMTDRTFTLTCRDVKDPAGTELFSLSGTVTAGSALVVFTLPETTADDLTFTEAYYDVVSTKSGTPTRELQGTVVLDKGVTTVA